MSALIEIVGSIQFYQARHFGNVPAKVQVCEQEWKQLQQDLVWEWKTDNLTLPPIAYKQRDGLRIYGVPVEKLP